MEAKFEDIKGKTLTKIVGGIGAEELRFIADDGGMYCLYYDHD